MATSNARGAIRRLAAHRLTLVLESVYLLILVAIGIVPSVYFLALPVTLPAFILSVRHLRRLDRNLPTDDLIAFSHLVSILSFLGQVVFFVYAGGMD